MEKSLLEKYKIHIIDGKRYYEYDMTNELPSLEHTIPYCFRYKDIEIYNSSWVHITMDIVNAIDALSPKSEEELLKIQYSWTKTEIFSREKKTNYCPFKNLYLNTNHTSSHAMMNIQGLLKAYKIPLDQCFLLIKRHFVAEPEEVVDAIRSETIKAFLDSLRQQGYTNEKINTVIKNFNQINKMLASFSAGYNDFFLFDDYTLFSSYKSRLFEFLEKKHYSDYDKTYRIVRQYMTMLDKFYYNQKKQNEVE